MLRKFVSDFGGKAATLDDLTGELFDALKAQGKVDGDRAAWVTQYSHDWYDQPGLPEIVLDNVTTSHDSQNGTWRGDALVRIEKYSAVPNPPLRMVLLDGSFEKPTTIFQDTSVAWTGPELHATFESARQPEWLVLDPDYDQLRWIPDTEKTPSLTSLMQTGPVTIEVKPALFTALDKDVNFTDNYAGPVTPSFLDGVTPPGDQNVMYIALAADAKDLGIDLGDNDARFVSIKNPSNPALTTAYAIGKDQESLTILLRKLPRYSQESWVTLKGGVVVDHGRSPVELTGLTKRLR